MRLRRYSIAARRPVRDPSVGLEELAWGSIGVRIEGAVGGASLGYR